jgi:Methyltransferase domain
MKWFWATAVEPLLEAVDARTIVEVGVLQGATTAEAIAYAERKEGILHGIDPAPRPGALKLAERHDRFVLHQDLSLNVLSEIDDVDAALIDGDHNWYTVINELRMLAAKSEAQGREFPLTFLHDVGWPYGRRDQYCDPTAIPDEYRQPVVSGGMWPGDEELHADSGANIGATHAVHAGTPRNGVLTAVEDFVSESNGRFQLTTLTGLHGLGILVANAQLESNERLRARMRDMESPEWLRNECERLEHARLHLQARFATLRYRVRAVLRQAG